MSKRHGDGQQSERVCCASIRIWAHIPKLFVVVVRDRDKRISGASWLATSLPSWVRDPILRNKRNKVESGGAGHQMSHSSFHTCNVYLAIHLHMSLHDNTHDTHTKLNALFFFLPRQRTKKEPKEPRQQREPWLKWQGYIGMKNWGKGSLWVWEVYGRVQGERSWKGPGCQHGFLNRGLWHWGSLEVSLCFGKLGTTVSHLSWVSSGPDNNQTT